MSETIAAVRPNLTVVGSAVRPQRPNITGAAEAGIAADATKAKRERKRQPRAENDGRAVIRIIPGEIAAQVDAAQDALIAAEAGVYQRAGKIVEIGRSMTLNFRGEPIYGQSVVGTAEHALREAISRVAQFEKWDSRSGEYVGADCPMDVPRTLLQRATVALPPLTGYVNHPTLRNDGSILETEGYDPATGILYDACGVPFPAIPDTPTYQDAVDAMGRLAALLTAFPFVLRPGETVERNANLSVALSAMLSAVVRKSMDNCPMHGFSAPVRGSGKSTLVDLASIMTTGADAACTSTGVDEVELEKRLSSLYLAGRSVIAIDNVSIPLGGDFLNMVLTQSFTTPRILGKSETPTVATCSLVCATGQNLRVRADMGRRVALSQLDPKMARPELRKFAFDPKETLRAHRPAYLIDALTVLRAWHVDGCPAYCAPVADYDQWGWIRNALLWCNHADPAITMAAAMDGDPELEEIAALLTQWHDVLGSERISCRNVIAAAESTVGGGQASDLRHPDFREALAAVCARGSVLSSKALGKWLKSNAMRVVDGRRFEQVGKISGIETWALVDVGSA